MFEPDHTLQRQIFAFTHRELVSEDSDVWLYIDLFESLDVEGFEKSYSAKGQVAKSPELILRTVFYALTHGIVSGRKLQDACRNDNRYIVLSGDTRPDRRTFDRFLKRHTSAIETLFVQVVKVATEMGLVRLGRVAIDGSRFKAYAGKSMRYDKMERALKHIAENLKDLREDLRIANAKELTDETQKLSEEIANKEKRRELIEAAKKRIEVDIEKSPVRKSRKKERLLKSRKTLHDLDALTIGESRKPPFSYNVQAAVDDESQIIVAADLHDNASDQGALEPLLEQIEVNCSTVPDKILADCGYNSFENIKVTAKSGSEPIIPVVTEYRDTPTQPCEQIFKSSDGRGYHCMNGEPLKVKARLKNGRLVFEKPVSACKTCPLSKKCLLAKTNSREVLGDSDREIQKEHIARCRTETFKTDYSRRKVIVEPVFGNIKNKGIRICVRGKKAVNTWWKMACMAHNIEKIVKNYEIKTA